MTQTKVSISLRGLCDASITTIGTLVAIFYLYGLCGLVVHKIDWRWEYFYIIPFWVLVGTIVLIIAYTLVVFTEYLYETNPTFSFTVGKKSDQIPKMQVRTRNKE